MNLVNFIRENRLQIVNEWIGFARENISLTGTMNQEEIQDHVEQMLERIVIDMESMQSMEEQKLKSQGNKDLKIFERQAASDHGEQRLDFGFNFMQLSSEFRALRASVLRLWEKKSREENWETDFHDLMRFNEAIDEVWMISLQRYQEKLDESKNLFLGVLGHDLRNPMTTVKSALSILKLSENLSERESRAITFSEHSIHRMNELIDNLLELTELRLGSKMNINKSTIDLQSLFKEIVREQQMTYPEVEIILKTEGPIEGNWDQLRLSQMMTNLLSNAIKHGEKQGKVEVSLIEKDNEAFVSVHNQGIPIPENTLNKIFDRGFSISESGAGQEKGFGLGLLIVKEIVEGHQGKIKVTSNKKEGTTFTAILPKG